MAQEIPARARGLARALTRSARLTGVGIALVASVVATACGEDPITRPNLPAERSVSQAAVNEAGAALCSLLSTDDAEAATRSFEDRAHETVHAIADAVRDGDPALAGALLEAKDPIETAVAANAPPDSYRLQVRALIETLGTAVEALGLTVPSCVA